MTPRERTVIRAVIRALEGGEQETMHSFCVSYCVAVHRHKPPSRVVAQLLKALIEENDRS